MRRFDIFTHVSILIIVCLLAFNNQAFALENEVYYSDKWCKSVGGYYKRSDVVLEDEHGKMYPDCIVDQYVVEADWAYKTDEGVGQAFRYARLSGKTPAVLLLLKSEEDYKYLDRLLWLKEWFHAGAAKVPFEVFYIEAWKV